MIRDAAWHWLLARRIYVVPVALIVAGGMGVLFATGPAFRALCLVVMLLGGAMAVAFRQQAVLRRRGDAPGVVEVDEARITYLAASGGQVVDRDALISVALSTQGGFPQWVLAHEGGAPLSVPLAATGADALSGLIEALPGADLSAARTALASGASGVHPVWQALARSR